MWRTEPSAVTCRRGSLASVARLGGGSGSSRSHPRGERGCGSFARTECTAGGGGRALARWGGGGAVGVPPLDPQPGDEAVEGVALDEAGGALVARRVGAHGGDELAEALLPAVDAPVGQAGGRLGPGDELVGPGHA